MKSKKFPRRKIASLVQKVSWKAVCGLRKLAFHTPFVAEIDKKLPLYPEDHMFSRPDISYEYANRVIFEILTKNAPPPV